MFKYSTARGFPNLSLCISPLSLFQTLWHCVYFVNITAPRDELFTWVHPSVTSLSIEKFKLPGTANKEKRVELLRTFQLTKADSITRILLLRTCFENSKNIVKRIITCIIFFI